MGRYKPAVKNKRARQETRKQRILPEACQGHKEGERAEMNKKIPVKKYTPVEFAQFILLGEEHKDWYLFYLPEPDEIYLN